MVLASTTTKRPRILIGRSGSEQSFQPLADGLRRESFRVTERASAAVGAHSTSKAAREIVDQFDMVFLVVRAADASSGPAFQQILREAGVIQGRMGMERVVLLVEESVVGLSPDTGVSYIRFPTGQPEAVLSEVIHKIEATFPPQERDLHKLVPIREQARAPELRWAWVLVGIILLLALLFAFRQLAGGDGGGDQETTTLTGVNASLRTDGSIFDDQNAGQGNGSIFGDDGTSQQPGTDLEDASPSEPAGPAVTLDGANQLLPATCTLDMRKGLLIEGAVVCSGAGVLLLDGDPGPWHNDLVAVAVSDGVVGTLEHELRSDGSTVGPSVIDLSGGTVGLNASDAAFGVTTITLRFSANNQHVHLFPTDGSGLESATLTFTIDR